MFQGSWNCFRPLACSTESIQQMSLSSGHLQSMQPSILSVQVEAVHLIVSWHLSIERMTVLLATCTEPMLVTEILQAAWPQSKWCCCRCYLPPAPSSLHDYGIGERLQRHWQEMHSQVLKSHSERDPQSCPEETTVFQKLEYGDFVDQQQCNLFCLFANYKDVFFPEKAYPRRCAWMHRGSNFNVVITP